MEIIDRVRMLLLWIIQDDYSLPLDLLYHFAMYLSVDININIIYLYLYLSIVTYISDDYR